MPNNLDLDAINRDYDKWDNYSGDCGETVRGMANTCTMHIPALIAEVERLRQESADFESVCMSQEGQIARLMAELATAKKIGAAEWHEAEAVRLSAIADDVFARLPGSHDARRFRNKATDHRDIAAELRAEVGK